MRRSLAAAAACLFPGLWFALGCAPALTPHVRGMRQAWSPVKIAFFLPVETRGHDNGSEVLDDAPQVVREALRKEFIRRGCALTREAALDSVVAVSLGNADITFGQAAQIAGKLGADVAIVGRVMDFRRGWLFGPSSRVELRFDVVGIDGQGLGTVHYWETAAQEDPAELARDLSIKLARGIDSAWGGCPVEEAVDRPQVVEEPVR